ncbi:hypothetical protein FQA39_LY01809 [Lamprigera yunnana]|nr:hypothetical protein FQA39_LY01809 [Lamprigera yunnana]
MFIPIRGVQHAEDGILLYDVNFYESSVRPTDITVSDEKVKNLLVEMVISFADKGILKLGDIEWKPVKAAAAGKEDCVYLNVYLPKTQPIPKENLHVIVHLHGGAFVAGSSHSAGPAFLMDKDIVYVNFNYRLGIFGFLSTEDNEIPGLSIQHEFPTADTTSGKVKGYYKYSYGKRQFAAFEGIPYIKQPLGDLRFEEPQNPDSWSGVFEATKTYNCIQKFPTYPISGEEDCIYLNVYVPRPQPIPDENLDVIVYIHGGAFIAGNCDEGGPGFIMDKDVVYVNFNYRIGILGFLSTGDSEIPGNYGLKDQVFALKWVRDNIRYFGGNPNSVTLAGMSAGAASVHYQYFSPLSKGLFHRGYSLSGTAFAPWTLLNNPLENCGKVGKSCWMFN